LQHFARLYKVETRQEAKTNAEERLTTGIEMLTKKEVEFVNKLTSIEREARLLVSHKRVPEAKQKLLERNAVRKRLGMTRSVLNNLQMFKNQMDDANVYSYSISAMSDMAKQFNFSSANMENLYKKLSSAQETFTEYVDHSEEMRTVLADGYDRLMFQSEDDLEAELKRFMEEDDAATPSVVVNVGESSSTTNAYGAGRQHNGVAYERAPPQQQSFLESIRAKHTTPVAI
jgi:citrate synthase